MPTIPRRVVTGHDGRGASVFAADGPVPVVRTAPDGALFYEVWGTDAMPAPISAAAPDPTVGALTVPPPPNGTKIRINEFPPGVVSPVHRTQSVDYGIVLDGEVVLVLDGEGVAHAGGSDRALAAGASVHLPRGLPHCLENTGQRTLVVLGVFYPGGSPAAKTAGTLEAAR